MRVLILSSPLSSPSLLRLDHNQLLHAACRCLILEMFRLLCVIKVPSRSQGAGTRIYNQSVCVCKRAPLSLDDGFVLKQTKQKVSRAFVAIRLPTEGS